MVARLKPCDYFYEENVEIRYRRVGYREFVVAGPAPLALVVEVLWLSSSSELLFLGQVVKAFFGSQHPPIWRGKAIVFPHAQGDVLKQKQHSLATTTLRFFFYPHPSELGFLVELAPALRSSQP
ncbi:unnamed protein product [Bathycoccus prasinos]